MESSCLRIWLVSFTLMSIFCFSLGLQRINSSPFHESCRAIPGTLFLSLSTVFQVYGLFLFFLLPLGFSSRSLQDLSPDLVLIFQVHTNRPKKECDAIKVLQWGTVRNQ